MMMPNINKQSGFTLVEIAIVLVIIGLLLGGILKGQELITSARVRNLADQNSGIQAAYYGFIDRYRAVPGDMVAVNAQNALGVAGLFGGDGNGQITLNSLDEAAVVWHQLSNANFITGLYPGLDASGGGSGIGVPGYMNGVVAGQPTAPPNAFQGTVLLGTSNEYQVPAGAPAAAARLLFSFGTQIPVNVLRELDVKIDDGLPQTGIMRATVNGGGGFGLAIDSTPGAPACVAAPAGGGAQIWNIAGAQQNCNAVYIY